MSGLLDAMSRDFSRRIELRRRMMAHLGLRPTEGDCAAHRDEIRDTLLACSRCSDPAVCEGWVVQDRPGIPVFCRARDSFLRLEAALGQPGAPRRGA
jgi:hypothetical protein